MITDSFIGKLEIRYCVSHLFILEFNKTKTIDIKYDSEPCLVKYLFIFNSFSNEFFNVF